MHSKSLGGALLLAALAALATAGAAQAQQVFGEDYAPADPVWPFPLYSTHPEDGGLYTAAEFISFRRSNPLEGQPVAIRGFQVTSPIIQFQNSTAANFTTTLGPSGTFIGSRAEALDVQQVSGPNDYQPGFTVTVGWKFGDGSAFEFKYFYLTEVNLHAAATLAPPGGNVGALFENSFLSSAIPVFNFPNDYAGPLNKITIPNPSFTQGSTTQTPTVNAPGAVFGIWNGASIMTEQFLQRFQEYEGTYRVPIYETETYRLNGIVGPRFAWIWERYKWTASDIDNLTGTSGPQDEAQYNNIISNRLYGAHAGCQQECYLGHGFAATCTIEGGAFVDQARTEVIYQLARGGVGPGSKRALKHWLPALQAEASAGLSWYPIEGVEVRAGYDFQAFFNTLSSPNPIDFNYGAVDPHFQSDKIRWLDGLNFGIGIVF